MTPPADRDDRDDGQVEERHSPIAQLDGHAADGGVRPGSNPGRAFGVATDRREVPI